MGGKKWMIAVPDAGSMAELLATLFILSSVKGYCQPENQVVK